MSDDAVRRTGTGVMAWVGRMLSALIERLQLINSPEAQSISRRIGTGSTDTEKRAEDHW